MLTPDEINQVKEGVAANKPVPAQLQEKLLTSLKAGEPSIFQPKDDDYLCCDLGIDPPDRYQWISFQDCKALGGSAVDKEYCGH